jgi:hypothetical protein
MLDLHKKIALTFKIWYNTEYMNTKVAKKLRQMTRKEIKNKFGDGMEILNSLTNTRPKYVPKIIWIILYLPLFKKKAWKYIYKNLE